MPAAGQDVRQTDDFVRTGDLVLGGYTESDFPRVQELAEGVYSYEELR